MKKVILIFVIALIFMPGLKMLLANELIWEEIGRGNLNLKAVLVNPQDPQNIYIGSGNGVFKSEDGGASWRNILSVRGQNRTVNFLSFDPQDKFALYAATGEGLFYSNNQGKAWKRIFRGGNYLENDCTVLAALPYGIYLGTKGGLFISNDKGRTWHKEAARLGKAPILAIASNPKEASYIYAVSTEGVFRTADSGKSWERIFAANPAQDGFDAEEEAKDPDEEQRFSHIRYITIDPNNLNYLYLATARGIYKSQDRGGSWKPMSDYGLLSRGANLLLLSDKSAIYAVTKSGIFEYKTERWQELSFGLLACRINFLAWDIKGNLYAASEKGLFKTSLANFNKDRQENMMSIYYKNEPGIKEVQEAAINYAEVEPEKIKQWRQKAAKKALLPQLSVGLDRNVTDLWHWEGGSTTKTDDDTLRKGHDSIGWDVTLSWDLSELIWNNDQTSIDARSRLLVQLRDDILDEVTKLYFERLRVKMELDDLSVGERKKRFEKELRLEELSSSLDALTGGYFSEHLKNSKAGS